MSYPGPWSAVSFFIQYIHVEAHWAGATDHRQTQNLLVVICSLPKRILLYSLFITTFI